jgi:hypothetical protein
LWTPASGPGSRSRRIVTSTTGNCRHWLIGSTARLRGENKGLLCNDPSGSHRNQRSLALAAPERYGTYYQHAADCSLFFSNFRKSIDPDRFIFARLHALAKKHHTLALFSTVRLHEIQSAMDLRQVLEAGALAAFAIANPDPHHFVEKDKQGLINPSKKLTGRAYTWLDREYGAGSRSIKEIKGLINETTAHSNLVYTNNLFEVDEKERAFLTPFFDREEDYHVKKDLWRIGHVGISLLDLYYEVNQHRNVIKPVDNFVSVSRRLTERSTALHAEMTSTERYKQAMRMAQNCRGETPTDGETGATWFACWPNDRDTTGGRSENSAETPVERFADLRVTAHVSKSGLVMEIWP